MIRLSLALAAFGLIAQIGYARAAEADILRCVAIKQDAERLKCFDSEAANLVAARAQEEKHAVGIFGFLGRQLVGDDKPEEAKQEPVASLESPSVKIATPPPKVDQLTAKIDNVWTDSNGRVLLVLDNGQIWENTESGAVKGARPGAEVFIHTSWFNGFRLTVTDRTGEYRVRRVQ